MSNVKFKCIERSDLDALKARISSDMMASIVVCVVDGELEVQMKLGASWSLAALRNTMKLLHNGTIMARTLNFVEHYDGKEYRFPRLMPGAQY